MLKSSVVFLSVKVCFGVFRYAFTAFVSEVEPLKAGLVKKQVLSASLAFLSFYFLSFEGFFKSVYNLGDWFL